LTLGAISSEVRKLDFKWYMKFIAFFGRTKTKRGSFETFFARTGHGLPVLPPF